MRGTGLEAYILAALAAGARRGLETAAFPPPRYMRRGMDGHYGKRSKGGHRLGPGP